MASAESEVLSASINRALTPEKGPFFRFLLRFLEDPLRSFAMLLPHQAQFRYRAHLVALGMVFGGIFAALLSDDPFGFRLVMPLFSIIFAGVCFLMFWLVLAAASFAIPKHNSRLFSISCLALFYFFSIGGVLNLLLVPFDVFEQDELYMGALMLSGGFGAAAGVYRVFARSIDTE